MMPDEQRLLAAKHGVYITYNAFGYINDFSKIATYTSAVEAKERERIAEWVRTQRNDVPATGEEFANAIRSVK